MEKRLYSERNHKFNLRRYEKSLNQWDTISQSEIRISYSQHPQKHKENNSIPLPPTYINEDIYYMKIKYTYYGIYQKDTSR